MTQEGGEGSPHEPEPVTSLHRDQQLLVGDETPWHAAAVASFVVDDAGVVSAANALSRELLPSVLPGALLADTAPAWLCATGPASGELDDRRYQARPVRLSDATCWWLLDDTDAEDARSELGLARERTAFLTEASDELLGSLNLQRCMDIAARLALRHLADAAWVVGPGGPRPVVVGTPEGLRHSTLDHAPEEVLGLEEALLGFPPVPSRWLDPSGVPGWLAPEGFGPIGSVVITPLPGHAVAAGALILLRKPSSPRFSAAEEEIARLFAARVGVALSAARMFAQQASVTDTLTRELLPPVLHQLPGVELAARYRPASDTDRVGGDFYDVHPADTEDGESLVVLGDVCGKGLEAAVLTGRIRSTVQALLPMAADHLQMLRLLNTALLSTEHTRFATMVLGSVSRRHADVRLRLTSAGHLPPLVVRANGRVEEVDTQGTLVGAMPEVEAASVEIVLGPGDTCLLYTDGITEARGGPFGSEFFGEERLRRALAGCAGMPAEALVERIQMLASDWAGRTRPDDMAVLAITAPRGQHLTAVGGHGPGRYTA